MFLYSVKDNKANFFMQVNTSPTDAAMIRTFSDAVKDVNSQISKHPEDFELWIVGEFDDQTGIVVGLEHPISNHYPRKLCSASDFLPRKRATDDVANPFTP